MLDHESGCSFYSCSGCNDDEMNLISFYPARCQCHVNQQLLTEPINVSITFSDHTTVVREKEPTSPHPSQTKVLVHTLQCPSRKLRNQVRNVWAQGMAAQRLP